MATLSPYSMSAGADDWRKRHLRPDQLSSMSQRRTSASVPAADAQAGTNGKDGADVDTKMQSRKLDRSLSGFEATRSDLVNLGLTRGLSDKSIRKLMGRAWSLYTEQGEDGVTPNRTSARRSGAIGAWMSLRTMWGPDGRLNTPEEAAAQGAALTAASKQPPSTEPSVSAPVPVRKTTVGFTDSKPRMPGNVSWDPNYLVGDDGRVEDTRLAAEITGSGAPVFRQSWDSANMYHDRGGVY